jgi:2,4-dienoyl-CoA reductase-like NADH-dependent reductase (Old Yellow Enzyme family)
MPYPCLFSPFKVRGLVTPNRVLLAPMGNNLSDSKGTITPRSIAYYVQRARDGVGMIITEAGLSEGLEIFGRPSIKGFT